MNYDPTNYSLVLNGILIDGFIAGTFIKIAKTSAAFSTRVGVDGRVTRTRMHDRSAVLTVSLEQAAPINETLSQMLEADRRAPNGLGVGALSIVDRTGRTVLSASKAWIQKSPDFELSQEAGQRDWEIAIGDLIENIAGIAGF